MTYVRLLSDEKSCNIGVNNTNEICAPYGFVTNHQAYSKFLENKNLKTKLEELLTQASLDNIQNIGIKIRELILHSPLPSELEIDLDKAYHVLCDHYNPEDIDSDLLCAKVDKHMHNADLQTLHINCQDVCGLELVRYKVLESFASLFTDRAIHYRKYRGYDHFQFTTKYSLRLSAKPIASKSLKELAA